MEQDFVDQLLSMQPFQQFAFLWPQFMGCWFGGASGHLQKLAGLLVHHDMFRCGFRNPEIVKNETVFAMFCVGAPPGHVCTQKT